MDTTHTQIVRPKNSSYEHHLYALAYSPICISEVQRSLSNYPLQDIASELIKGLRFGFQLQYSGSRLPVRAKNSRSVLQNPGLVLQKINKEINMGRIAGPFVDPPFPTLRVSPISLIPKNDGDFRLIHNLSYPMNNSVNDFIDRDFCSVRYSSIDDAVKLVKRIGQNGLLAKADVKSAFRLIRVFPGDFDQLGFTFQNKFYFDKCLPMGASISCAIFEKFSTALHWQTEIRSENRNIQHYLDDFLFGGEANTLQCQKTLSTFREVCSSWGVPLAEDKTVEPTEILTFLGIEFDTQKMELRLPAEKLVEIKIRLESCIKLRKITLRELQSIIGLLNFACQVVAPGRAFCRRLIDATCNVSKPHHRIRVSNAMKDDLHVWISFLSQYNGVTVMLDSFWTSNEAINLFTDSAGGKHMGFGVFFQGKWTQACWPEHWIKTGILSDSDFITFLELFPVVVAINIWGSYLKNKKIIFNSDNQAVVTIINKKSSKSERVMSLVRSLVLSTLTQNIMIKSVFIKGKLNMIADSLSRCDWQRFRRLCPTADHQPAEIPDHLWKLWNPK